MRCKAKTKEGTRCMNPAAFDGYCATHYTMELKKKLKGDDE